MQKIQVYKIKGTRNASRREKGTLFFFPSTQNVPFKNFSWTYLLQRKMSSFGGGRGVLIKCVSFCGFANVSSEKEGNCPPHFPLGGRVSEPPRGVRGFCRRVWVIWGGMVGTFLKKVWRLTRGKLVGGENCGELFLQMSEEIRKITFFCFSKQKFEFNF